MRQDLTLDQKDFLYKVIPLARLIQEWTRSKAHFIRLGSQGGLKASVTIAEIISVSNWGTHPIAQPNYERKYSNNLILLEAGEQWKGKTHSHSGRKYRAYKNWSEFAVDYSDHKVFTREFDSILLASQPIDQIKLISLTKASTIDYNKEIITIINSLGLLEFDVY